MPKKTNLNFVCKNCGREELQWIGKCPSCTEWNTFFESKGIEEHINKNIVSSKSSPKLLSKILETESTRLITGISEFDRTLGGGIVSGSFILLGGDPGVGKSTLLLEVSAKIANIGSTTEIVLYISGEESEAQVASRAKRLNIKSENLLILHETSWELMEPLVLKLKPRILIIDSIQTTFTSKSSGPAGSPSQVKDVTHELLNISKGYGITTLIIGHMTKDGSVAGPKLLEHMVDVVLNFEGKGVEGYRFLRVSKNRFGDTKEIGIFEMNSMGLKEVKNPSESFIEFSQKGSYGCSLSCILEGARPIFVETQALVIENKYGSGKRATQGIELNRLTILIAIIEKYFGIPLQSCDIYVNVVGGIRLGTRETDLSIVASIISSYKEIFLSPEMIFLGEIGLNGEVRSFPMMEVRINEISQLNYKDIVTNEKTFNQFNEKYSINFYGLKMASDILDLFP